MSGPISTKTRSEITELIARSILYQFLAHLFRHPHDRQVRKFVEEHTQLLRKAVDHLNNSSQKELKSLAQKLFKHLRKIRNHEWAQQYERCFGHTAHSKVPAYELEYGEEHSHRQPQELADIAAFYRAFGLQVTKQVRERVDHVSVECEFMYFLTFKEAHALEGGQAENASICKEASSRFLADHLGRWLPAFALRLSKFASEGLIKSIADFAFLFLVSDCGRMGTEAGPSDLPIRMIQEREETDCISCVAARAQTRENEITSNPI